MSLPVERMAEPKDVVAYLRRRYPANGLSRVRLRRMAYLADWKSALERGRQMTGLVWVFGDRGPGGPDAERLVEEELSGRPRSLLDRYPSLTAEDRRLLRFVARSVEGKGYPEMEKLVYSTYPLFTGERHSELDLTSLAGEYVSLRPLLAEKSG